MKDPQPKPIHHTPIRTEITRKMEGQNQKMKILCLHGFRTSGKFLQKQLSKWDPSLLLHHFQMDYPDGLFPAGGKSDIEGVFPPPYFEWFQFNKDFTEYTNLEECISHLCQYITNTGPFHGLLGFSQGATLCALLLGYKAQGKVLKEYPPFKMFVSISGSKFRDPSICEVVYKDTIKVKSLHFIGAKDWLRLPSEELATAFEDPLIIRHPQGHTVPRLDEESRKQLDNWIANILSQSNGGNISNSVHEVKNIGDIMKVNDEDDIINNNQRNKEETTKVKVFQNEIINNNQGKEEEMPKVELFQNEMINNNQNNEEETQKGFENEIINHQMDASKFTCNEKETLKV